MGHEIRMRFAHIIFYVAKGDTYFGYALCTMHFALEKTHQRINFTKNRNSKGLRFLCFPNFTI
jgi:hypothetical protein